MEAKGHISKFDRDNQVITIKAGKSVKSAAVACFYESSHELQLLVAFMEGWRLVVKGSWNTRLKTMYIEDYKFLEGIWDEEGGDSEV